MAYSDRRTFLSQSIKYGCLTQLAGTASFLAAEGPATESDPLSRMKWMNEPPSFHLEGGKLRVHSTPKADFYRLPDWIIDDGNFFHLTVAGDFTFEARINGRFVSRYDQAGFMVRHDAENWMKGGIEFIDGVRYASTVVTRGFSDWATMKDLTQTDPVWWRIVRRKESIEALCSLDGKTFQSVRQAYFPAQPSLEVGLLCASTEGQGVEAYFDSVKLSVG